MPVVKNQIKDFYTAPFSLCVIHCLLSFASDLLSKLPIGGSGYFALKTTFINTSDMNRVLRGAWYFCYYGKVVYKVSMKDDMFIFQSGRKVSRILEAAN